MEQSRSTRVSLTIELFQLADGSVGLGPGAMKDGDKLVLLAGGTRERLPMSAILRPSYNGYKFVGITRVPKLVIGFHSEQPPKASKERILES